MKDKVRYVWFIKKKFTEVFVDTDIEFFGYYNIVISVRVIKEETIRSKKMRSKNKLYRDSTLFHYTLKIISEDLGIMFEKEVFSRSTNRSIVLAYTYLKNLK